MFLAARSSRADIHTDDACGPQTIRTDRAEQFLVRRERGAKLQGRGKQWTSDKHQAIAIAIVNNPDAPSRDTVASSMFLMLLVFKALKEHVNVRKH